MKQILSAVIAACLLLAFTGCDAWRTQSYHSVTPHEEYSGAQSDYLLEVSSERERFSVLKEQISSATETFVIYVTGMALDTLDDAMQSAIQKVTHRDPIGAYAVEAINYEIGTSTGRTAIALQITYNRTRSEILQIRHADNMDQAMNIITEALRACKAGVVIQIANFKNQDITQRVQDYVDANPHTCMEMPQVSEAVYPDTGAVRVLELTFTYQTSREALRSMQSYVQPIFRAGVLNVSGEEEESVKFDRMYAFLMERREYQLETSLTPAYSLLRHGVGDSRAFATVYAAMCREAGLECRVITGTRAGEPWTWNMICENGVYYHVDLLQSNSTGAMQRWYQDEMEGYVWDYSAYPVAEAPEPPVAEPTESAESVPEESQPPQSEPAESTPAEDTMAPTETETEED